MIVIDNIISRSAPNIAYDAHLAGYAFGILPDGLYARLHCFEPVQGIEDAEDVDALGGAMALATCFSGKYQTHVIAHPVRRVVWSAVVLFAALVLVATVRALKLHGGVGRGLFAQIDEQQRALTEPKTIHLALRELPREILDWRGLAKLKGTYIDALPQLVNPQTGRVLREFDVSLGLVPNGPKQREGDFKTPEGRYVLDSRNVNIPGGIDRIRSIDQGNPLRAEQLARARDKIAEEVAEILLSKRISGVPVLSTKSKKLVGIAVFEASQRRRNRGARAGLRRRTKAGPKSAKAAGAGKVAEPAMV